MVRKVEGNPQLVHVIEAGIRTSLTALKSLMTPSL